MYLQAVDPFAWCTPRAGESKLGEHLRCLPQCHTVESYQAALTQAWQKGARIALLGAPESIGPRANCGRGGAEGGWESALAGLLNLQYQSQHSFAELLLVGTVDLVDLQQQAASLSAENPQHLKQLRELTEAIDERVSVALEPLFAHGFQVILVGGGHNNAYPLLQSLSKAEGQAVAALNLDPHADFRGLEGRHSGNGFSYAQHHGYLAHYHVHGLHPFKNNQDSLQRLHAAQFSYTSIHDIYLADSTAALLQQDQVLAQSWHTPFGIEVDVDAIQAVPASAYNANGVSLPYAFQWVAGLAELQQVRYLHLAEAAPALHPAGLAAGKSACGQVLSELILAFLLARHSAS